MRYLFLIAFLLSAPFAQAANVSKETCEITGTVIKSEQWLTTPYGETPSNFSNVYTRLTVEIDNVKLHEIYDKEKMRFCKSLSSGSAYAFKLCATKKTEVGNIINGVVGPAVGAAQDGCLFDVQVIGQAQPQPQQ